MPCIQTKELQVKNIIIFRWWETNFQNLLQRQFAYKNE